MDAWGFEYRANLVWTKPSIGLGYWCRNRHELLLIGRRGKYPLPEPKRRADSVVEARRGRHSEKPARFYELIEHMYPHATRLELFRPLDSTWLDELGERDRGRRMNEPTNVLELIAGEFAERIAARLAQLEPEYDRSASSDHASPWLSVESAAAYLDWPKQRLYKLTASGAIPHYKQEGRLLFHRGELDRWLASFAQPTYPGRA